ncbi:hypothetical protein PP757_gp06 [Pseudomonas phage vB_PaeP_TUMS_P121]|uniref:Uncharacterized protein n=1 Tax=Pseudomonas phage vB_PaeP_TUMS_P121 TaxID=2873372 RepID=A0AAE8YDS7_9CAUD|nr:hypothetical protein PP757_gp06 [Pseudomonas phage vB_PaeP_TUMS_P121]UEP18638.1 hypothetical protein [Pseudomonas phage vB_PaeP_TUMS_P121]UGL60964.1 hypothetical protein [Pseudomonas phage vB_PaeS_TUMS_P81]WQA18380.1 hypothetical protein [Pseudomonas phage vB_Pae_TUMS_P11]
MQLEPYARHIVNGELQPRNARVEVGTRVFLLKDSIAYNSDVDRSLALHAGLQVIVMGLCLQYNKEGNLPLIAVQHNNSNDVPFFALVDPNHLCYAECPVDRVLKLVKTEEMQVMLRNSGYEQSQKVAELLFSYGIHQLVKGKL